MDKGGKKNMNAAFAGYVAKNKDKIRKFAASNTTKNKDGLTIISKNDTWRKETEWDEYYNDLKEKE